MEPDPAVLESLRNAVSAMPDDVPLRLHLAALLLGAGHRDEAIRHLGAVLQRDPGNSKALTLLTQDQSLHTERSVVTPPDAAAAAPAESAEPAESGESGGASSSGASSSGAGSSGAGSSGAGPGEEGQGQA
ncbi:MAG: tetratricopeptide repeat protein, partial [Trebonia sp.]